jgi:uncharacterized membrane protein HdeD (DUF308 family)
MSDTDVSATRILAARDTVLGLARTWWLWLLLGIWAAGHPGRSLFVFVNLVGVYAVFHGLAEVITAFDLRRLGKALGPGGDAPL